MKPLLVYLVDDDQEDQHFFSLALKRIEFPVACEFACNGIEAVKKVTSDPMFTPDYIFIDVNMPMMNGIECLTELRKLERIQHIPIYIYSTSSDHRIIKNCLDAGAQAVLQKMNSIEGIRKVLNDIFSGQEASSV